MKISGLFSDGMILQRGKKTVLYGETEPNERVNIFFHIEGEAYNDVELGPEFPHPALKMYHVKANEYGYFEVSLEPRDEAGPFEITVSSNSGQIKVGNIIYGDVFLLGGQSNMELTIGMIPDENEYELSYANNSDIRMFKVPAEYDFSGEGRMLKEQEWKSVNKDTIADFSAIGYFFAKEKYRRDGVPVGLIHTAVGGAPIEALMGRENLLSLADEIRETRVYAAGCNHDKHRGCIHCYEKLYAKTDEKGYAERTVEADLNRVEKWHSDVDDMDEGLKLEWWNDNWEDEVDASVVDNIKDSMSTEGIMKYTSPGFFKGTVFDKWYGTVWLQKTFYVSEKHAGKQAKLYLGTLVDFDETYVNGKRVGSTEYRYPQRRYIIPEGVIKPGKNTVTIRLGMDGNIGGFLPDMPYKVSMEVDICKNGSCGGGGGCATCSVESCNGDSCSKKPSTEIIDIPLTGDWLIRAGARADRLDGETFFIWHPSALFYSMIAPLSGYGLSAILFYQGESNDFAPEYYDILFKGMVKEWRGLLGDKVPVYFAEVAVYYGDGPDYKEDCFKRVRKAQGKCASDEDEMYLIETTSLPAPYNELHPQNKKPLAYLFYKKYSETI